MQRRMRIEQRWIRIWGTNTIFEYKTILMKSITNLTVYNDDQQDEILNKVAKAAPSKDIRISQALGLSIHIIEDHKIIA